MSCGTSSLCSNQGECIDNTCNCNPGFYSKDCSINQFVYDLQLQLRQNLMNSALSSMTMENIPEIMSIMDALTQQSDLNANTTLNMTLNAATQAIQLLDTSSDNPNLATDIQALSNLISDGFDQVIQLDCGLFHHFSLQALNQSYELLQELSDKFIIASNNTPGAQLNISTNAFLMHRGIYNSSQLNNLQINISDDSPQIQLSSLQNEQSLPSSIALTYIYSKENLLKCDSAPATNFTLEFKNAQNLEVIKPNASILITYPQSTFGLIPCPNECARSNDPKGNTTCFCKDISIFDVKSQLGRIYNESNLRFLTLSNISKIFSVAIFLHGRSGCCSLAYYGSLLP